MSFQVEREVKILIERDGLDLSQATKQNEISQVYFLSGPGTIRIRRYPQERYEVTFKFSRPGDASSEYNLPVSQDGATLYAEALEHGFPEISKVRYEFRGEGPGLDGLIWEVDLFRNNFDFLTVCELEYPGPARPQGLATRPSWYHQGQWGVDVSSHGGFRNSKLVELDSSRREQLKIELRQLLKNGPPTHWPRECP